MQLSISVSPTEEQCALFSHHLVPCVRVGVRALIVYLEPTHLGVEALAAPNPGSRATFSFFNFYSQDILPLEGTYRAVLSCRRIAMHVLRGSPSALQLLLS